MFTNPKKDERRRKDMAGLPPNPKPILDTFESVVKALVKPVVSKKESGAEQDGSP